LKKLKPRWTLVRLLQTKILNRLEIQGVEHDQP
jgi:hypothetical protein